MRWAPALTLALFLGPVLAGLIGTALPAFDYLPALDHHAVSLAPWRALLATPGLAHAAMLSLWIGFAATAIALALAVVILAGGHQARGFRRAQNWLAPLLAMPHAAVAIGFGFLIAPSGWLARPIALLLGWDRPPDVTTLRDEWGMALIAALVIKETPYLLLVMIAALNQIPWRAQINVARGLGYGPARAFVRVVAPQLYGQIRLPLYAVLVYGLANVEMALVLAPTTPPPLAVLVLRDFVDPDLARLFPAAAGAVLMLVLAIAAIALWRIGERIARRGRGWLVNGRRGQRSLAAIGARAAMGAIVLANGGAVVMLALWSVARGWRFPDLLPAEWTAATWTHYGGEIGILLLRSAAIAALAALIALTLAIACLEHERRDRVAPGARVLWLIYLPLLIPQIAFLGGWQVILVRGGLDGGVVAVTWSHLAFVLPYVFLALADPWRALDPRFGRAAASLGASPARVLSRVIVPMLTRPLLVAFAIGFQVSIAQYLATLFAGAGRIETITTAAVTLAAGGDRRVAGAFAFAQSALPLIVYALAIGIPLLLWRRRAGMEGAR